jgi:high potential iron-sulfur protein
MRFTCSAGSCSEAEDIMENDPKNGARRDMLAQSGLALASLALVPVAALWSPRAHSGSAPKGDFHYQPAPRDGQRCADCRAFVANPAGGDGTCRILAGSISPNGWCMAYSSR